jgi:hypothetical protein
LRSLSRLPSRRRLSRPSLPLLDVRVLKERWTRALPRICLARGGRCGGRRRC